MHHLWTVVAALLSSPLVNPVSSQTLIGNWTDTIQGCVDDRPNRNALGGLGPLVEPPGNADLLAFSGLTFGLVSPYCTDWAISPKVRFRESALV